MNGYGWCIQICVVGYGWCLLCQQYSQLRALACVCVCFVLIRYCILEQLEGMGFNRELVLEVFFACNKDEELAANYLLDHGHEFDEQQQ